MGDNGEVITLSEFRQTPNGKIVVRPLVRKGGEHNPNAAKLVTGGIQPNTTFDRQRYVCDKTATDCYRVGWTGIDD